MKHPCASDKPTLESLLRVKRAERPEPEFWQHFESEMRRKQLAATIEPKPWWLGLAILSRKAALPVGLPMGAAAAVALAFVSFQAVSHHDQPGANNGPALALSGSGPVVDAAVPVAATPATGALIKDSVPAIEIGAEDSAMLVDAGNAKPVAAPAEPEAVDTGRSSDGAFTSLLAGIGLTEIYQTPVLAGQTPSQRHIADNLAEAREANPEMASALGLNYALGDMERREQRAIEAAARKATEGNVVLASADLAPRAARLLAVTTPADEQETAVVAANIAREQSGRLNDDILYASANRLGVGGDRLSISF